MKNFILSFLFLGSFLFVYGQEENNLPKSMTSKEKENLSSYRQELLQRTTLNTITTPPNVPVRTAAEWEEIQTLFVTWKTYPAILRKIIEEAQTECEVMVICTDSVIVKNDLNANSIPTTNVKYLQVPNNTIWMRDYGGNTVYTNDVEDLLFVDWIYNRPRPKDDTVANSIANSKNIPLYAMTQSPYDLVNTGGNFMTDGQGTAFASKLVLNENIGQDFSLSPKTEFQIDTLMHDFMGIQYGRYIKMETLPYDGIHHIDMHMKLLDEETLLVGEYPLGVADGPQIEANLQYVVNNFNSIFGTPYKVVRIPMPPDGNNQYPNNFGDYRTYSNAVFVNKKILLPIYEEKYDTTALRIWQQTLPGYNVIGIPCNDIIQQSGAIHCITHSLGISSPLLIVHQAHVNTNNTSNPYTIQANIQHQSGIQSATIHWRLGGNSNFQTSTMTSSTGNTWIGTIPPQSSGNKIEYYIDAIAINGKQSTRPITAPNGFWTFTIGGNVDITDKKDDLDISIYPNPSYDKTYLSISSPTPIPLDIHLFDILGRKCLTIYSNTISAGKNNINFDVSNLPRGIYFLKIEGETTTETKKLWMK